MLIFAIQLLSFLTLIYLWTIIPLRFLSDPIKFIQSKNFEIRSSYWLFYSIDLLYLVLAGLAMLVAGFFADLKFIWLIISIGVLTLALISLATIIMKLNLHQDIDHQKEIEKSINNRLEQIPQKKKIAIFKIAVSILWIYSWKSLFIF